MGLALCLFLAACGDLGSPRESPRAFRPDTEVQQVRWLTRAYAIPAAPPPRVPVSPPRPSPSPAGGGLTDDQLRRLRNCESGGRYGIRNYPYSGAYQAMDSTWGGYGGYRQMADAPPEVQDEWTRKLWGDGSGAHNWPVCRYRV